MNIVKRPIFGIFPDSKIGQLFDLRDESFLPASVLKTDLTAAIRISDEKRSAKIEVFHRPISAEFIASLSNDDLISQLKAHANIGLFKTLTTDPRILSPNSDALISIKFTFRKKLLKLKEIDSNILELNEKLIAKSQFAVTELELGQWIFASISCKNDAEMVSKFEPVQEFFEKYFTDKILEEIPEIPPEASEFLYKFVSSETIFSHAEKSKFSSFKEFFEFLKSTWDKNRCFPIAVTLTSLLDLGLLNFDNRLETLQSCHFDSHEFYLRFFRESEMAIYGLQGALASKLKIFAVKILKKLRQSEMFLMEIMERFRKISIYNEHELEHLKYEIIESRFLSSIEAFLSTLEAQFSAKQSNFIDFETQKLLMLSPSSVKFALIIGESEKQKIDFINFLINFSHCSSASEALNYKMSTFLPYSSNAASQKSIILTKNGKTIIFVSIFGMTFTSAPKSINTNLAAIFRGERQLNTVILLFSKSSPLRNFQAWIPGMLKAASKNFIYFNFFAKNPINSEKWKEISEALPTGSLYFLNQKVLKQNFGQMPKSDLEMSIQNIHQILRKICQSRIIDGIQGDTVVEFGKVILESCREIYEQNSGDDDIDFLTNLASLCKSINDPDYTTHFKNNIFSTPQKSILWDTIIPNNNDGISKTCQDIMHSKIHESFFQSKLTEFSATDIITYSCEAKSGISFFNEGFSFSTCNNAQQIYERKKIIDC